MTHSPKNEQNQSWLHHEAELFSSTVYIDLDWGRGLIIKIKLIYGGHADDKFVYLCLHVNGC